MSYSILTAMLFFSIEKTAYISCFNGTNAIFTVKFKGIFELTFVFQRISSRFMMTDELYVFLFCIIRDFFNIKIRVRFIKFKGFPIFPTFIPAFYKHSRKFM